MVEYCGRSDTREALDAKVVRPLLHSARSYVAGELGWMVRALQALGALVVLQTALLVALLWMVWRL